MDWSRLSQQLKRWSFSGILTPEWEQTAITLKGIIGSHGTSKMNSNGLLLLSLCTENNLAITNTLYRQADKHKTTWMHPRSKQGHMIDFAIVRRQDIQDVCITRAMQGAECWTDHWLVRTTSVSALLHPSANDQRLFAQPSTQRG